MTSYTNLLWDTSVVPNTSTPALTYEISYIIIVPASPAATEDIDLSFNSMEFSSASTMPTCTENIVDTYNF